MRLSVVSDPKFVKAPKFDALVKKNYSPDYEAYVDKKLTISKIAVLALKAIALLFTAGILLCFKRGRIWAKEVFAGGEIVAIKKSEDSAQYGFDAQKVRDCLKILSDPLFNFLEAFRIEGLKEKIVSLTKEDLRFLDKIFCTISVYNRKGIEDFNIFRNLDDSYVQFTISESALTLCVSVACWPPEIDCFSMGHVGNWAIGKTKEEARQISTLNGEEINFLVYNYVLDGLNQEVIEKVNPVEKQNSLFNHGIIIQKIGSSSKG
ncbi:hypothetical protein PHSC3_002072 [Chlamydiales bacterium STE3]|nr:hypothetical protein PHSC3_002072 [Chlamydiales bacterium STE3]